MADLKEVDIMALPLSDSSDDDTAPLPTFKPSNLLSSWPVKTTTTTTTTNTTTTTKNASAVPSQATREPTRQSKRRKIETTNKKPRQNTDETSEDDMRNAQVGKEKERTSFSSLSEVPDWLSESQSSQSQRPKQKMNRFGSSSQQARKPQTTTFKHIDLDLPLTPKKKKATFSTITDLPGISPSRTTPKKQFVSKLDSPDKKRDEQPISTFQIPGDLDFDEKEASSFSTAVGTNPSFEIVEVLSPSSSSARNRRDSSSSLSSIDSLAEYQLDLYERARLESGTADGDSYRTDRMRCPVCKRFTDRKHLTTDKDVNKQSLQAQQNFCFTHRMAEAEAYWQEQGYPTIEWDVLVQGRVPRHLKHLHKVVRREQSSFYLDALDSHIKRAKGHQKKIQSYFDSGMMEVVKQGYYGPKGAKIISNAIAGDKTLQKLLHRAMQSDKTMRTAGFGRLIDSVLLPELTMKLVMEDMNLNEDEKAREILNDSSDVGLLLNADDDHVVREEEDEDVYENE